MHRVDKMCFFSDSHVDWAGRAGVGTVRLKIWGTKSELTPELKFRLLSRVLGLAGALKEYSWLLQKE